MPRAHYDENGNIILVPSTDEGWTVVPEHAAKTEKHTSVSRSARNLWTTIDDEHTTKKQHTISQPKPPEPKRASPPPPTSPAPPAAPPAPRRPNRVVQAIRGSMNEGREQVRTAAQETKDQLSRAHQHIRSCPKRFRRALSGYMAVLRSPVSFSIPAGKNGKPPSKVRLFFVDTVRFGGTFLAIFLVLFIGINFESFWQIAKAQLALDTDTKTEQALGHMAGGTSTTEYPALDGTLLRETDARRLVKYLPSVGPFQNRIVIPKIGKNVPIVRPSMDALVKEDWKQFENDIQTALRDGVVHYPGSAKPGQAGNFFVTGHSSYYAWDSGKYKSVFARLGELVSGDTYTVYYNGDKHTYKVISKKEVLPSDVSVLDQPSGRRYSTLMTCTPVGTTLRRLIVTAEEIDPLTGQALKVGQRPTENEEQNVISRLEALPI